MATYKFKIRHPEGIDSFDSSSVKNWASLENEIVRNVIYKGITRAFTNQFDFVGSIRDKLLQIWDNYDTSAEIFLTILVGNDNKERKSYEPIGSGQEYKADISTAKEKLGVLSMNFIDTGYQEKLLSRDGVKINYNTITSIDGDEIAPFENETQPIVLHDRIIDLSSVVTAPYTLNMLPGESVINQIGPGTDWWVWKWNKVGGDSDVKNINTVFSGSQGDIKVYSNVLNAEKIKSYNVSLTGQARVNYPDFLFTPANITTYLTLIKYDADNNVINDYDILEFPTLIQPGDNYTLPVNIYTQVDLQEDESFIIALRVVSTTEQITFFEFYPELEMDLFAQDFYPQTQAECIQPYELFTRLAEVLTGEPNSFYSTVFGRTDLGYAEDGEWAYLVALNGKMVRGFPLGEYTFNGEDKTNNFTTKLREAFEAYSRVINLYATIELIGNKPRLRIEKHRELFDTSDVVDLGNVIYQAERSINTKQVFTAVNVGYKEYEYEKNNGLDAYNGTFTFSTPNKIKDNVLDLVSQYRADDYGIEFARRTQFADDPTTDTRYDKHIFLIDAYKSGNTLLARRAEQFDSVTGILSPNQAYNLNITPKRNLLRHGNILRSSLLKSSEKSLTYTDGATNAELQTQKTGEVLVIEKADVLISELDNPKFVSEFFNIEVPITEDQFRIIINNPNIMIKFVYDTYTHFGFIDEFKYNFNEGKAIITLIRANR